MKVRRVVTGHDASGRSKVVADEEVAGMDVGGGDAFLLWGRDDTAHFPDDGHQPSTDGTFPPIGGCRLAVLRLASGEERAFDQFVVNGLSEWADPEKPGMHRTASLDFDLVLSGDLGLRLDEGEEVVLHAGDVVVQNGTRHRWRNVGTSDAVLAAITIGAENDLVR
jgi:mannose-6-phosphate isomerase-like protein (cupin superfamily)